MEISPFDDGLLRHIVWHHSKTGPGNRFVNVPLAAFDNPRESFRHFSKVSSELKAKQINGDADPREYIFCDSRSVDHKARHRTLRLLRKLQKIRLLRIIS